MEPSSLKTFPGKWEPLTPLVQSVLDDSQSGIVVFDLQLRLAHITSGAFRLLGIPEVSTDTDDLLQLLEGADVDSDSLNAMQTGIFQGLNGHASEPVDLRRKSGARIELRVRAVGPQYRAAVFRELPEKVPPESLPSANPTFFDSLTGLSTRLHFEKSVSHLLAEGSEDPIAVFLLDLDRFKAVNDSLGHAAGDAVLRLTAQRLQSVVRETDVVSRLGGDEFAIMIRPAPGSSDPETIARRIVDLVGRTYLVSGHLVNVGASIGIALGPKDACQYDALLRCADLALYQSKSRGRGIYHFFDPEMDRMAQARRTNELDLRRALALRQLEVFYQAQVSAQGGQLVGFEALLRWRHPVRGLVPPNEFLGIAEEIGVIVPIGEWVLRKACREAMKWPASITVAVNASPLQFETGRFAESVQKALLDSGLPGCRLEVEITEGILLRNEDFVLKTLNDLRSMGVRIAMDDFGTGYASLSQLAKFPFNKIKIDKSLVGAGGEDPKHRAIVRAISTLSDDLGLTTTAEGVETADQLARVQSDGCGSVQGYLFSRPVPTSELTELIARFFPDLNQQSLELLPENKHEHQPV